MVGIIVVNLIYKLLFMSKQILLIGALIIATIANAQTKTQHVTPNINNIIVYLQGAQIVSNKQITLQPGRNEIVFEKLSPKIIPNSIQVKAGSNQSILSINQRINYLSNNKENARLKQLNDSLLLLNTKITAFNDERGAYETERNMLNSNQILKGNNTGVSVAELRLAADFYRSRIKEINSKISELNVKSTDLQIIINRINNEIATYNLQNQNETSEISVLITAPALTSQEIELRYLVSDAGWAPAYDIKAEDIDKPIQLNYNAKVFNNTNIDWNDVNIKLSTSDPNQSASKPELNPWYLNYVYPSYSHRNVRYMDSNVPASAGIMSMNNATTDSELDLKKVQEQAQQGNITYEEIEISQLSAEFEIKQKYTIPSDAKPYLVQVKEFNLPASYKHYCAPKINKDVFLLARITGWEQLDLVEGYASVYFAGTYIGESYIKTQSVNDTLDLSLGRDNKVLVMRDKQKDFTNSKLAGTNKKDSYAFEFSIKNNRKSNVLISVVDQLPVSQNAEIIVEDIKIGKGTRDEANGFVSWDLNVAPSATEKFEFSYSIKYPKNKNINEQQNAKRYRAKF